MTWNKKVKLSDLTDVDVTLKTNGSVLAYDSTTGKYKAQTIATGGASKLSDLTDVDVSAKGNGYVLTYDSTLGKFVPKILPTGTGGGSTAGVISLNQLEQSRPGSWNLIDNTNFTNIGYVLQKDNSVAQLTGQAITDYIQVEPNGSYRKNFKAPICFYDANKTYLSGLDQIQAFVVPNDSRIKYMKTSVPTTEQDWFFMYKDTVDRTPAFIKKTNKIVLSSKDFEIKVYKANAEIPLFIETYAGGLNQPIHPCVVSFDTAWNGYKFWLAYTPFPNGSSPAVETPCIAASNDAIKWVTPAGITNPIVQPPANAGYTNYNSDTHMIYNSVTLKLECWYREVLGQVENIKRVTSSDGITWAAPELCFTTTGFPPQTDVTRAISPCVIYENSKYRMWIMDNSYVRLYESTDGLTNWVDKGFVTCDGKIIHCWHLHVFKNTLGKYELLNADGSRIPKQGILTHFTSDDGVTWTNSGWYMLPSWGTTRWDNIGFYRSCLFQSGGRYYLMYSGISDTGPGNGEWLLGLAISEDETIYTLKGLDASYAKDMAQPTKKNPQGKIGDRIFDTTLNKMIFCTDVDKTTGVRTWRDVNGTVV